MSNHKFEDNKAQPLYLKRDFQVMLFKNAL